MLHSPSLAVCSKPTDLPIEKSKHQRKELSYFFAWNFLVKRKYVLLQLLYSLFLLRSHFFQLDYMQLQGITNGKVLAALTSFLLIIIAVHNSKTYIEELKSFSIVK